MTFNTLTPTAGSECLASRLGRGRQGTAEVSSEGKTVTFFASAMFPLNLKTLQSCLKPFERMHASLRNTDLPQQRETWTLAEGCSGVSGKGWVLAVAVAEGRGVHACMHV